MTAPIASANGLITPQSDTHRATQTPGSPGRSAKDSSASGSPAAPNTERLTLSAAGLQLNQVRPESGSVIQSAEEAQSLLEQLRASISADPQAAAQAHTANTTAALGYLLRNS